MTVDADPLKIPKGIGGWVKNIFSISSRLDSLQAQVAEARRVNVGVFQSLMSLAEESIIDPAKQKTFQRALFDRFGAMMSSAIDREERLGNPLSPEEITRLRQYYAHAQQGGGFTPTQAQDFNSLARRLEEDRARKGETDWGAIALAALAGFILAKLLEQK
ncbi:MAG: hypothetical protein IT460_01595 [Planctomycetes bacterium]|nr:hypothetical protein [Planctomycetota bacterium]